MAFDPQSYIDGKSGFDPDAYAGEDSPVNPKYKVSQLPIPFGTEGDVEFAAAKVGSEMGGGMYGRIRKTGEDEFEIIGNNGATSQQKARALTTAIATSFIPGGAGMVGAGWAAKAVGLGNTASRMANLGKMVPVAAGGFAGGAGAGAVQDAALRGVMPDVMLGAESAQQAAPVYTIAGGIVGGNAPYQKIGKVGSLASEAGERLLGSGLGAGIAAGTGGGAEEIGGAALGGLLFNNPTKLGAAGLAKGGSITSKLGNASTKDSLVENISANNDIALATPVQATIESDLLRTPPSAADSAQVLSGLMPNKMASESARAMVEGGVPKDPNLDPGLDLGPMIQNPENIAERAKILDSVIPNNPADKTLLSEILRDESGVVDLQGFSPVELKQPMDFGKLPGEQNSTDVFNKKVQGIVKNLAAEGVELDRQTALKLARITDRKVFNDARQALIDSVRTMAPEVPNKGPIPDPVPEAPKPVEAAKPTEAASPEVKPVDNTPEETHTSTVVKTKPTPQKFEFVGEDPNYPAGKGKMWNISKDIVDAGGNVIHPKGSTINQATLEGYGLKVPEAPAKAPEPVSKPIETTVPVETPTTSPEPVKAKESPAKRVSIDDLDGIDDAASKQNKSSLLAQPLMSTGEPLIGAAAGYLTGDSPEDRKERAKRGFAIGAAISLGGRYARGKLTMTPKGLQTLGMTAYHGTPHKVDKFSKSKIGTGEGAQVYGHGLYFAENPDVAKSYRDKLGGSEIRVGGKRVSPGGNAKASDAAADFAHNYAKNHWKFSSEIANAGKLSDELINSAKEHYLFNEFDASVALKASRGGDVPEFAKTMVRAFDDLKGNIEVAKIGNLYEVDVDLKPENTLDWDKPLSEQNEFVRDAIFKALPDLTIPDDGHRSGSAIYHELAKLHSRTIDYAGFPATEPSPKKASEVLESFGIKGVAYADQGSRGQQGGTKNFVVFDDSLVKIKKENDRPVNPMSSERGSVINPFDGEMLPISKRALDTANEPLLKAMAKTDVENTNPTIKAAEFGKQVPEEKPTEPARELDWAESAYAEAAKHIDPKKVRSSIKSEAENNLTEDVPDDVISSITDAPEDYVPGLSDLASRFPRLGKLPGAGTAFDVVGGFARAAKSVVGTVEGNVKDGNRRMFGGLRTKIGELNEQRTRFSKSADPLGELARKNLTKEQFNLLDAANLSGDRVRAEAVLKGKPNEAEMLAAYDSHQATMKEIRDLEVASGRDVGDVDNYFHRKLIDRDGLLKALGSERSTYKDALKAAATAKNKEVTELTDAEKDKALNDLIIGSMRSGGKPGFLKPRTIGVIEQNILKFYEPFDVATHAYIMSATRDISNRKWFGKTAEDGEMFKGNFGRLLREEVESGRLDESGKAFDQVVNNLKSYFTNNVRYDNKLAELANKARRIQTYAYLADMANMVPQFADFFSAWRAYGLKNASKGYFSRKFTLEDINIHESHNQELEAFTRNPGRSPTTAAGKTQKAVGQVYDKSMRAFLGWADGINKGGIANAAYRWVNDVVKNPSSPEFKKLNEAYSKTFPEQWPAMLKDLQSPDFAKGKLSENSRFFLFNELANLQPLDAAGRAKGYNDANPWVKILYTLRSYGIKQLDIMRDIGYNKLKSHDSKERREGLANMIAYGVLVGMGQQAATYAKDKFLGRTVEPTDYAVAGLMQLAMVPRYAVYRAKDQGIATAALETMVPGVGLGNDITKDIQLFLGRNRRDSEGQRLVRDAEDFFKQSRTVQYLPAVGREIYWHFGRGAESEKKNARTRAEGKEVPSTLDSFFDMANPPDLKVPRGN